MLIEAHELTRHYGALAAVDHVSFGVDRGEIVGLLGPNGAGKTTTMRMLTCYLPVTAGYALVAGYDVREQTAEVRRHIGYMPENNPLYPEMRVREYLKFRAELKGVPRRARKRRIGQCMELCGVEDVGSSVIGTLSKGYCQRVGIADALLGDPEVLILDEPTIGLDPNQIRQTRSTIQNLSEKRTVLLSTHILQEVEAVCKRVLIIDKGRIVADDTPQGLSEKTLKGATVAELKGGAGEMKEALVQIPQVSDVAVLEQNDWTRFSITTAGDADVREQISSLASARGWALRELTRSRASLEDVFHRITVDAAKEA